MTQPPDIPIRFILNDPSGRLLKWLRMLGFDTICRRDCKGPDPETDSGRKIYLGHFTSIDGKEAGMRIHLKQESVTAQLQRVMAACGITREKVKPFSRCTICNETTQRIEKNAIRGKIPDYVWETQEIFRKCPACGRIYWRGTHAQNIEHTIQRIFEGSQGQGFE